MNTRLSRSPEKPIGVFYEHPEWFNPMFDELDRRSIPYEKLLATQHTFDPEEESSPYSLILNRMSPSAFTRGNSHAIFYTLQYLSHLKNIGANVLNGYDAYVNEFSKARQLSILHKLGLRHPKSYVINHLSQAIPASARLRFPVIIKPNIGGSGAHIVKFNSHQELETAVTNNGIEMGMDQTALIQEYLEAKDNRIIRIEILGGQFLYAIQVFLSSGEFNLCPADYCKPSEEHQHADDTLSEAPTPMWKAPVERFSPPDHIINNAKQIMAASNIEVGGVEYLINESDDLEYYYDINALSNFVANPNDVIGFDPFPSLVDFVVNRATKPLAIAV